MKKVIVTGANGFIGSLLIKKMIAHHIFVIAISRSFSEDRLPKSSLIARVESDLSDLEWLKEKIPQGDYDAFYHFAWQGVNGKDKANPIIQMNNIRLMIDCASMAKQVGCKKFLCSGTVAEQSVNSLSHLNQTSGGMMYGVAKHCAHLMLETYCKNIGLNFVWMQFSNIYGPTNRTGNLVSYTIGELVNNQEATFGPAQQPYDFIYIEDLLEAVYRLGDCSNDRNCYFIGSGQPHILKEYLLTIGGICGKPHLIKIGKRPDDGIAYTMDMFDVVPLTECIGEYVSHTFKDGIRETLKEYVSLQESFKL